MSLFAKTSRRGLPAVFLCTIVLLSAPAPAGWPPPETATASDLADPANWPNDPGYGYSKDSKGQWNYYSFMPTQSGSNTLRPEEKASGMSIDLAWRWTQGDDAVRIAVMDSGIKWDEADLIERAWLNPGELNTHKPTKADSSPCGGMGELAGFDCNDDGIFTVSDYADSPALQPDPSDGHPRGDKNNNGRLDAGDLISNFSDGKDDDNNGYVDDISGWDFMKADNNPYDDTRYGHGTGEARDSTATGNNGMGGIGGCPKCRFIPMRVGDSFIADVNNFAQAVIYATDNGASIVQCALGTINMNRFAQQALDYSYSKGVLNVISMADENARHHNMPASANHTLPVHAITFGPGSDVTNAETFLAFNTCTNYGGQNYLSVSGEGCSSEAVGQLSGMAGLLYSAARKYGLSPPLSAAEAMQLWINTADDIDVPESREKDSSYYWSQPGFDQRCGYGRANADTAVRWVKDGKIPPEIDVVRPFWFEVLYRDQVKGPVEVKGTIAAPRANSYDYVVEWAPGVQPLDSMFKVVAESTNEPSSVVTGGEEPLALLDIRTMDTSHEPDIDSPHGENANTFTVRIRATAHYGGEIGDVPAELRRTYSIHDDPDLLKGFPIYLGDSGEGSPKLADLDGDGNRDIIYPTSGGRIHAYKITASGPEAIDGWPFTGHLVDGIDDTLMNVPYYPTNAPGYKTVDANLGGDSFTSAPAIADIDGDGKPEVVATSYGGHVYVIEHDGKLKDGWPIRLPAVPSCPRDGTPADGPCMDTDNIIDRGAFAAPVLVDMNKDGKLDIVQAAFDGKVYVFEADGQLVDGWPVEVRYDGKLTGGTPPARGRVMTTPAVADFNDDGYPEVFVGSNQTLGTGNQSGAAFLIDGRGTAVSEQPWMPNWPITMTSFYLFPLVAEGTANTGVVGSFGGELAAVIHGNANLPFIMPLDPGPQTKLSQSPPNLLPERIDDLTGEPTQGIVSASRFGELTKAFRPNSMLPLFGHPSLADIDQDGTLDVIAQGSSLNLAINLQAGSGNSSLVGEHLAAVWSGKTGAMLPGSPFVLEDYSFFNSQAVADLDGDDYPEVIVGSAGYFLHAFNGCGEEPEGWPKFTGQWIIPTAAVGDLDGDEKLEVVTGTRSGWLYAWHTEGRTDGIIEWESYHHDNRNTGNADEPLEQGDPNRRASEPLTVETCMAAQAGPPVSLDPTGGCACRLGQQGPRRSDAPPWGWFGLALALALRRRRKD